MRENILLWLYCVRLKSGDAVIIAPPLAVCLSTIYNELNTAGNHRVIAKQTKERRYIMQILATARNELGTEFKLVKVSNDFYMYGTQKEFDSLLGVSVDRCGTRESVLMHCESIAELCKNYIEQYKKEEAKSKNPEGWRQLIKHEQSELSIVSKFAEVLRAL